MFVLLELGILFISFVLGLEHIDNGNIVCSIIAALVCLYLIFDLRQRAIYFNRGSWRYSRDSFTTVFGNRFSYGSNIVSYRPYTKKQIAEIENKFKNKKHNFIEFCNVDNKVDNQETKQQQCPLEF